MRWKSHGKSMPYINCPRCMVSLSPGWHRCPACGLDRNPRRVAVDIRDKDPTDP